MTVPNSGIESCQAESISNKQRFKSLVNFIYFVNQQHAWPLAFERTHQGTRPKEVPPLEVRLHSLPVLVLALGELHVEPLQALVEAADRFVLGHAAVALQPFNVVFAAAAATEIASWVLPTSCGPFEQQRFLQLGGEKDHLGHHRIDEVPIGG